MLAFVTVLASCKSDSEPDGGNPAEAPPANTEQPAPAPPAPVEAPAQAYQFPDIEGKYWVLTRYQYEGRQERPLGDAPIHLSISGNQFTGNGGCNSLSGRIEFKEGGAVSVSGLTQTEKACRGLMTQEIRIVSLLQGATAYKVNLVFLEFNGPEGLLLFRNDVK